jgi:hypothetical protein
LFRQAADLARRGGRKTHTLANDFVGGRHSTIIHQYGDSQMSAKPDKFRICQKILLPVGKLQIIYLTTASC